MSLTQHLHTPGPLRTWWQRHTAGLTPYIDQLARYADVSSPRLSAPGPGHAAMVGGIVGRLLETRIEAAPPYAAILGVGRRPDATRWPSHAAMTGGAHAAEAVEWRPTPAGWQHLVPGRDVGTHSLDLHEVAQIETDPNSDLIARATAAGTVASLESAYRSRQAPQPVTAEAVADAVMTMRRQRAAADHARQLCGGQIRGHAAPVFAPHWADGDILLGPGHTGGYGLIDVKTVGAATVGTVERVQTWLWQLLSYAAVDHVEDLWRIRAIGVWLPRQDALVIWPQASLWRSIDAHPVELAEVLRLLYQRDLSSSSLRVARSSDNT